MNRPINPAHVTVTGPYMVTGINSSQPAAQEIHMNHPTEASYEISYLRTRIDILQLKLKQVEATRTVQQNETKQEQEENQRIEAAAEAVYGHYSRAPLTAPDCVRNLVWLLIGRVL